MNSTLFELPPEFLPLANFLALFFLIAWQIIKNWWWLPLPFILWRPFLFLLRWWRIDYFLSQQKSVMLEIKMPKDVLKPIRAMESVMAGLRQATYDPEGSWWEKWVEGKIQLSIYFEIISLGGDIHFYIRVPQASQNIIEPIIYSQYPEAEISVAEDYTKNVPKDIPNKDWDVRGADYRFIKPNPYPIKTYVDFETEHEAKEEKRIDPLASLLEGMAKVRPTDQLWLQIIANPLGPDTGFKKYEKEGQAIKDKLARREKKKAPRPIIVDVLDVLITGKPPEEKKEEKELIPPEMKLTPGEREIISAVERKIGKPGFTVSIRYLYIGPKKDPFGANWRLPFGFFGSLCTENLNAIVPYGKTFPKIHSSWFLPLNLIKDRRLYIRKRKLFKNYIRRDRPLFPFQGKYDSGTFILNVEELATIFHFPSKLIVPAPFVPRIEAKKGEAPPGLPVE